MCFWVIFDVYARFAATIAFTMFVHCHLSGLTAATAIEAGAAARANMIKTTKIIG